MPVLKNRAYVSTATTGTGTITLGSPVAGYQSFTDAGLTTGAVTRYTIQDGANWEIGLGTYTTSGNTLTRTPSESSNSGSAINLSGNSEVFIAATAEDVSPLYDANFVTQTTSSYNGPSATGTDAIAIGLDALASGTRSVGIGALATGTNVGAIASGNGAVALGGSNASGLEAFSANNSRNDATFGSTGANSVTLGYQSRAQATYSIAIGYAAIAGGQYGIALGFSRANGDQSFSIGQNASTASGENTIVIGKAISSSVDNQIAIGGTGNTIKLFDAYTLPTSDGAAGTALVTNGSGALAFSAVGADLYAANPVSATDPVVNGNNSIAIGSAAVAGSATGNNDKIAIGTGATAGNNQRVLALGYFAAAGASGQSATAVGSLAVASGSNSTALGSGTDATATSATALGYNAQAVGSSEAIAIGNSRAGAASSIAGSIVNNSSSYGTTGVNSVAFGTQARATNNSAASIGQSSIASGYQSAAYGYNAVASGQDSFAGGSSTDATATRSTALGNGAQATHANATAVGYNAATSATNQVALGASGYAVRVSGAYTLPTADGSANTFLKTDGSGALSFATVPSVGGSTGVDFNDGVKARFGTGNDLEIYHDGTANHSYIKETNSSGHLIIQGQEIQFKNAAGTAIMDLNSAQVELRHSGNKKLETTSSGIQTTGTVNVNGAYTLPTADGAAGTALVTNGSGALSFAAAGASSINGLSDGYSDASSVGLGTNALLNDDGSANKNTAVGIDSLKTLTSGSLNTVLGWSAGYSATSAASNTAVGYAALYTNTTGGFNVAAGRNALYNNTGSSNVAMGYQAGVDTTSGSYNTFIGHDVRGTATTSQQTALGYQARTAASEAIAIGNSRAGGIGTFAAQIGANSSSYGATGNSGTAIGGLTKTTGLDFVFGRSSIASGGSGSLSLGMDNTSSGAGSVTLGKSSTASGANAVAIGNTAVASGENAFAIGSDTDATGLNSLALGKGAQAVSTRCIAMGLNASASADRAISIGNNGNVATGTYATSIGSGSVGSGSTAAGDGSVALSNARAGGSDSFAAVIGNNTSTYGATATHSVAFSYQAKATQNYAFAHGYQAQATGNSTIAMGFQAQASDGIALGYKGRATALRAFGVNNNTNGGATGNYSTAIGDSCLASGTTSVALGFGCTADALGSVAIGRTTDVKGIRKLAYAINSLSGNYDGSSQTGIQVLSAATTDATPIALATNSTASTDNQVILPNNSAYAFHGTIVARQQASGGTACAAFKVEGLIRREANAGTTVLVNSATTVLDNTPSWGMALSADTTNGGMAITVTGAASTNIRWVATIHTSEVTYA